MSLDKSTQCVWEFYGALDGDAQILYWGWRRRDESAAIVAESATRFPTFQDCYVDARLHGFSGSIDSVQLD
jgi:hypothetical protein